MGEHDAEGVAADDRLIETLRNGGTPPSPEWVVRALAAWWREVHEAPPPNWTPIYETITGERLFDPSMPDRRAAGHGPATTMLPGFTTSAGAEDLTHDDYLVTRTDNGLKPADLGLSQPPQDPTWTPDDDG